ncbi:MAG: MoaD/ThiS family protein [Clostridiales bacterium]|nr:MoaD/ThiS family protein [Clostridiales bacterium]
MVIYLKAGGELRAKLQPDVDDCTRRVETEAGVSLRDILAGIGINPAFVAFALKGGDVKRLDYVPAEGDVITLQPPVSGG